MEHDTVAPIEPTTQIQTLLEKANKLVRLADAEERPGTGTTGTKTPGDKLWQASTHQSSLERAVSLIQVKIPRLPTVHQRSHCFLRV
eukprot:1000407-Prorocentrum_minimum.AAC.2